MVDKAAELKKKAPEAEAPVVEEEDLFEDFAPEDGHFSCPNFSLSESQKVKFNCLD